MSGSSSSGAASAELPWRRAVRRTAYAAFILVVVPYILWTYLDVELDRQLEGELAALRARGMPLTTAEAVPDPVPDAQNAALVYQQVFRIKFLPGGPVFLDDRLAGLSYDELSVLEDYVRWGHLELEGQARELVTRPSVQRGLRVLRRGSRMPRCLFPMRWEKGHDAHEPHLSKLRQASDVVLAHALALGADGQAREALDWCLVALRMSRHAVEEPTAIAQLVGYDIHGRAFHAVRQLVSDAAVPPEVCRAFEDHLVRIDLLARLQAATRTERAWSCSMYREFRREPRAIVQRNELPGIFGTRLLRPLYTHDQLKYLAYAEGMERMSATPYRNTIWQFDIFVTNLSSFEEMPLVANNLTTLNDSTRWRNRDRAIAEIALCRVALALKLYKHERSIYPRSLGDLQSTVEYALPTDPFSGREFIYQPKGDGFSLYSLGWDLDDDGGVPYQRDKWNFEDCDIVWECVK